MNPIERVLDVLHSLGAKVRRSGAGWMTTCPAHEDRTPSLSLGESESGRILIHCFAGCSFQAVLSELCLRPEDLGLGHLGVGSGRASRGSAMLRRPRASAFPDREARRPARDEVIELWNQGRSVGMDRECSRFLLSRGLDAMSIEECGILARCVPKDVKNPDWARCGVASWSQGGWRLIIPLIGPLGEMESLHARHIGIGKRMPKGVSPAGCQLGGLVMADRRGIELLRGQSLVGGRAPNRVLIVEGVPDFLKAATCVSKTDPNAPAILGVLSGSWTPSIAERIPDGCLVSAAMHQDQAGDRYAENVRRTLAARCSVFRVNPQALAGVKS